MYKYCSGVPHGRGFGSVRHGGEGSVRCGGHGSVRCGGHGSVTSSEAFRAGCRSSLWGFSRDRLIDALRGKL